MKPVLENISNYLQDSSFYAYSYTTTSFDFKWHFHPEYELTFIVKGNGHRLIGNSHQEFSDNDFVLIGPNIPHAWVGKTKGKKVFEATNEIEAWGDGTPIRDFVYGGDVADAILDLYEKEIHTTINFGAGEEITIKSMIEQLIEISGKNISIKWDTSKPNGDLRRQMDTTKQEQIGLLPTLGFESALKKTYDYYDKHK